MSVTQAKSDLKVQIRELRGKIAATTDSAAKTHSRRQLHKLKRLTRKLSKEAKEAAVRVANDLKKVEAVEVAPTTDEATSTEVPSDDTVN